MILHLKGVISSMRSSQEAIMFQSVVEPIERYSNKLFPVVLKPSILSTCKWYSRLNKRMN